MNFLQELNKAKLRSVAKPKEASLKERLKSTASHTTTTNISYNEEWSKRTPKVILSTHDGSIVPMITYLKEEIAITELERLRCCGVEILSSESIPLTYIVYTKQYNEIEQINNDGGLGFHSGYSNQTFFAKFPDYHRALDLESLKNIEPFMDQETVAFLKDIPLLQPPTNVKVLVLQRNCVSAKDLDSILTKEVTDTNRKADFVILPEGAHHEGNDATVEGNTLLRDLAKIVAKHQVWACLGTMSEAVIDSKDTTKKTYYCTALIVGPNGKLVTTYRKRATQGASQTPGTEPCCFDTQFGRVGVMICYDAENKQFVKEALDMKPVLMLNPVHIAAGAIRSGGSGNNSKRDRNAKWRTSMVSMGRYMDHLIKKQNGQLTWIRCDQPYPIGAGTSQITSECCTQQVPCSGRVHWSVIVEIGQKQVKQPRWICRPPIRDRTLDIDNCGNRYTMKNINITLNDLDDECGGGSGGYIFNYQKQPSCNIRSTNGQHHLNGILQIVCKSTKQILSEIDLFCLIEIKKKNQSKNKEQPKMMTVSNTSNMNCGEQKTTSKNITDRARQVKIGNTSFYLDLEEKNGLSMMRLMKESSIKENKDECRHIFIGPSNGIDAYEYFQNLGIIVTISKRSSMHIRNILLSEIEGGSTSNKASFKINTQRRTLTIWEFSQHRHPIPLHDLLS
jgi:hypothetical protein